MSNYNIDKYALPNKWIAEDFEKLTDLYDRVQEKARKEEETKNGNKVRVPGLSRR